MRTTTRVGLIAGAAVAICGLTAIGVKADSDDYSSTTVITRHNHVRMFGDQPIRVLIDRQPVNFDGPGPIMVGGDHVFVPVRGVFEQMGGYVEWHPDNQVIHGSRPGGHEFRIQVGSTTATVNGVDQTIDAPPILRDGTTYVPLRFASEALGARVHWHADTDTVSISTHDNDNF